MIKILKPYNMRLIQQRNLLAKLVWPQVLSMMEKRQEKIQSDLDEAERSKVEAASQARAYDEKIVEAHHIQTEDIQAAIRGEKQEYSLLFAHAQDTLMTIYSEIIVAKQLIAVFESYERRLTALESR